jgi:aminocarboxymuconate-semialdehyde decarboxylase
MRVSNVHTVDTHFHWYPRDSFEALAESPTFPRTERVGDGYRFLFNGGNNVIPLPAVWFDLDAGFAASEAATGSETAVVSTTGVLSGLLDQMPLGEAVGYAHEMNEALAKVQRERAGRFFGTASVPLQDTAEALAVLEHAIGRLDLRGVNLPPLTGTEPIDVARLEPFYARVEELGVPLIVHPTDLAFAEVLAGYGDALQRTIGRPFDSSITILRLVFSGIMHRYPALKVLHTHAGGLLPQQAGRIDKNARIAELPEPPSTYLKRIYVDTVAPHAAGSIRTALEFYGAERVLYGTDYPCWSPTAAGQVIGELGLDEAGQALLFAENAHRIFDLS